MSETMSTSGIKDDDDTKDEESEIIPTTPEREQLSKHSDSSVKCDDPNGLSIMDRQRTDSRDADVSLRVKYSKKYFSRFLFFFSTQNREGEFRARSYLWIMDP